MEIHNDPEKSVKIIDYRESHFKVSAKFRLEQNDDQVLRNRRAKIEGEPYDETEFTQYYRYEHYLQNVTRKEM